MRSGLRLSTDTLGFLSSCLGSPLRGELRLVLPSPPFLRLASRSLSSFLRLSSSLFRHSLLLLCLSTGFFGCPSLLLNGMPVRFAMA